MGFARDFFMEGITAIGDIARRIFRREPADRIEAGQGVGGCEVCADEGWVPCRCGGALCICENHGEKPCPKCQGLGAR